MNILLAYDGSAYADRAALYLVKMMKENPSAKVTVLTVAELDENMEKFLPSSGLLLELRDACRSQATETMEKVRQLFDREGLKIETVIGQGVPSRIISTFAGKQKCDMIVMGKHGLNDFEGILMGSVTRQVISLSHCPVLVVK